MKRWYAVYTQPHKESLAKEHLERQGFDVFLPRYLKRRSHARKVEDVPSPLFPRYIFAAFDAAQAGWRVISSTRGVVDIVRSGLSPVPVPSEVVDDLKLRADSDSLVTVSRSCTLRQGDRIRLESGPFAEYEAIFQAMRDEDRVIALLSLLGRKVRVQVPVEAVLPV